MKMSITKGMILAAGFGTRLLPLTQNSPKPLLEVKGKKLLQYSIEFLLLNNIQEIIINTHYLHEQIQSFVSSNYPNIKISYEETILDTGGGILNALPFFQGENFLVLNSDTIWTDSYVKELHKLINIFHQQKRKAALLLAKQENSFDKNLLGDFNIDHNNLLNKKEKKYIFTGCQILSPLIFNNKNKIFSMNVIWDQLIQDNSLLGHVSELPFLHATNLEIFHQLNKSTIIDL